MTVRGAEDRNEPSTTLRWGVAGTGGIANTVARELELVPGAEIVAVGSRSQEHAEAFANEHRVGRAHGSYEALIADPEVDLLYIATPNSTHYVLALAAIRAGKAVVVEKAFTCTLASAVEVVTEARMRKSFAMEAMWTRFHPAVARARALILDGAIGEVTSVQASLGLARDFDPLHRLFAAHLGGGALLDLGPYVASFADMLLGRPETVSAVGSLEPNGVDGSAVLLLGWPDGRSATLTTSLHSHMPASARVFGTKGWLDFPPMFIHPSGFVLHRAQADPEQISLPPLGAGYVHELIEATECAKAGLPESTIMPLDDTLAVMGVLEEAALQLGITRYEDDRGPAVDP